MGNANGRSVWSCAIDIEFPGGMDIDRELYHNGKVFRAVAEALESVGCHMAGDYMSAEYDQTDIYEDNDYFEESLKESYGVYRIGGIGRQQQKWADQGIPSKEFKDKDGFVNTGFLVKTFDNLEDAKAYARERRKEVSRDELWQTGRSYKVAKTNDKELDYDWEPETKEKSTKRKTVEEYKELLLTDDDLDESCSSKKEEDLTSDSTKTFTVEYTSGNSMSREETYSAIDAKDAIDQFIKTHTDDDYIVGVYDEYDVEYDPETGEEI